MPAGLGGEQGGAGAEPAGTVDDGRGGGRRGRGAAELPASGAADGASPATQLVVRRKVQHLSFFVANIGCVDLVEERTGLAVDDALDRDEECDVEDDLHAQVPPTHIYHTRGKRGRVERGCKNKKCKKM